MTNTEVEMKNNKLLFIATDKLAVPPLTIKQMILSMAGGFDQTLLLKKQLSILSWKWM